LRRRCRKAEEFEEVEKIEEALGGADLCVRHGFLRARGVTSKKGEKAEEMGKMEKSLVAV